MRFIRKLRAASRLLAHWDTFKHAFDTTLQEPDVKARVREILASDPILTAHYATLSALWKPVEADLKDLR